VARSETPRLARRWDLTGDSGTGLFVPRPYKPVYVLPATWTDRVNRRPASPAPDHTVADPLELRPVEAKYQLSLKAQLARELMGTPLSLWGGYTQSSRWQVYNGADSRPFRETNYEPELMLVWPLNREWLGWRLGLASLSLNHQSNGRALPLSRSWNRLIGTLAFERGEWVAEIRPWWRIPEREADDDNPDINDYVGRMELQLSRYWGDHALSLQLRHTLRTGARSRGSAQLDWVFPLSGALHGYLQVFGGHGESLVDYNLRQTKIGLGVTITGWQ
jgi:phospholipase A1